MMASRIYFIIAVVLIILTLVMMVIESKLIKPIEPVLNAWLAVLIAIASAIWFQQSLQRRHNNCLNMAIEYLKKRKFIEQAIDLLNTILSSQPKFSQALMYRGLAYYILDSNNIEWTLKHYNKAIASDPKCLVDQSFFYLERDLARAFLNHGNAYAKQGLYDRAIQDYDKAIKLNHDDALAYLKRGIAYRNKGDYDQAIQDLDQALRTFDLALKLKPDFAEAYYNRGLAYAKKGDYDRAIDNYDKAIKLKDKT